MISRFAVRWVARRLAVGLLLATAAPCPSAPLTVMAIGDSNTVGTIAAPGAYRTRLWQDFGSDPERLAFLGSQQSGPPELGDRLHEGYGGFTIAAAPVGFGNITDRIDSILNARQHPDVILLMIGTNDMNLNYEVDQAPARLDHLIGRISDLSIGLRPDAKLIVASVPPIDDARNQFRNGNDFAANSRVNVFNAAIPGMVAARRARGEHVYFADVNRALAISDIADGLHPTRAGYDKIGDVFYSAIVTLPEPASVQIIGTAIGIVLLTVQRRASAKIRARHG